MVWLVRAGGSGHCSRAACISCSCSSAGTAAGNTTRPGWALNTSAVIVSSTHEQVEPGRCSGRCSTTAVAAPHAAAGCLMSMTSEKSVGCSTSFPPRRRPFLQACRQADSAVESAAASWLAGSGQRRIGVSRPTCGGAVARSAVGIFSQLAGTPFRPGGWHQRQYRQQQHRPHQHCWLPVDCLCCPRNQPFSVASQRLQWLWILHWYSNFKI